MSDEAELRTVAIVGAGAVARAFAAALADKQLDVEVWARRFEAASDLEWCSGVRARRSLAEAIEFADVCLICVSDRAIEEVARLLAEAGCKAPVLHTSGYHDESVLEPLAARGIDVGSLHPLKRVPPGVGRTPPDFFRSTKFAKTGTPGACAWGERIASTVGGYTFSLPPLPEAKKRYHAAASLLANGSTVLWAAAWELLGVDPSSEVTKDVEGFKLVKAMEELEYAHRGTFHPVQELTGPAVRGDAKVVEGHLALMHGPMREAYVGISRLLVHYGLESGRLDEAAAWAVLDVLDRASDL